MSGHNKSCRFSRVILFLARLSPPSFHTTIILEIIISPDSQQPGPVPRLPRLPRFSLLLLRCRGTVWAAQELLLQMINNSTPFFHLFRFDISLCPYTWSPSAEFERGLVNLDEHPPNLVSHFGLCTLLPLPTRAHPFKRLYNGR